MLHITGSHLQFKLLHCFPLKVLLCVEEAINSGKPLAGCYALDDVASPFLIMQFNEDRNWRKSIHADVSMLSKNLEVNILSAHKPNICHLVIVSTNRRNTNRRKEHLSNPQNQSW